MSSVPPGAHWIRAALQVNPYDYKGKNQPSTNFASEVDYNKALLDECQQVGVDLIAVTDHWCVDSANGLIADAKARGIVALPGFEANSSEGVHLLVIFEADTRLSAINAAIGACGASPGCDNGVTGESFTDILAKMTELDALVIPAHVNIANSGMLTGRSGPPLVAMVTDPNLHAIAVTPSKPDGIDQALITKGSKPYARRHPLAVIHSDDIVHPDQLKSAGGTTWFKVSSARVESLKLAVRTPETRVAIHDPSSTPRARLTRISWKGGFLDGVSLPISSDLTALIGGRGTGKSTVIESLRYALDLTPIGKEAATDHKSVVDKVLRSGTIVTIDIETVSPTPKRFTIERMVPDPPVVRDSSNTATQQKPVDVIGPVEVFGQHELAELAGSSKDVAQMLRRFAGASDRNADHDQLMNDLSENREALWRTEHTLSKLEAELADIPRLEEQVKQFTETDVATRLADLQRLTRDEAAFTEAIQRVISTTEALRDLVDPQLAASLNAIYEDIEDSPQRDLLEKASAATTTLAAKLEVLAMDAAAAIAAAQRDIETAKSEWEGKVKPQREGNAEVLRKLHDDGLEPDKYLDTSKALQELKAKEPRLDSFAKSLRELLKNRNQLLGRLADHERAQQEALHSAVRTANEATGGVVVVRPIAAPDRDHILEVITSEVSGPRTQIKAAVEADDFSPRAFAAAVREGSAALETLGIRGAQANNLIEAGEILARQLEELLVGSAVEVLLDISVESQARELRKMDELSKGQRATALLILLLGASTAPLVIDQPEDDLDNRFVYDGVVTRLRALEGVRQIIASTHNANVPVLGDAELIIALEGDGQHGKPCPDGIGSLDDESIRKLAERILEGGPAAFNARHHLYGF